jgi:hypothetical protein
MANTYVAIATVTVGSGGASNIEFTSIPATYTDLTLMVSLRSDNAAVFDNLKLTFNSNTSNYQYRSVGGNGSSANSDNFTSDPADKIIGIICGTNATSSTFGNLSIYVPNYTGSTNKSVSIDSVQETNGTLAYMRLATNLWSNTSAITSIKLEPYAGTNFLQYSTATLYGIKSS